MVEIMEKRNMVQTIPIWQLAKGSHFKINNSNLKGVLIYCDDNGDAKVKVFRGVKVDSVMWSRETPVIPISIQEFEGAVTIVEEAKKEKFKELKEKYGSDKVPLKRERFGSRYNSVPGRINMSVTTTFQTTEEIGKKAGVPAARVLQHLVWWKKNGSGIGRCLKEDGGKWCITE